MQKLIIAGNQDNDLVSILRDSDIDLILCRDVAEALADAPDHAALMVLADRYPEVPEPLPPGFWKQAAHKQLKLYLECPSAVPGVTDGETHEIKLERAVIASDVFGGNLRRLRVLTVPGAILGAEIDLREFDPMFRP